MKAITLYQPWASMIANGSKRSETRHWNPPQHIIGQYIAIHAGKNTDHVYEEERKKLPFGVIVCFARLSGASQVHRRIVEADGSECAYDRRGMRIQTIDDYGNYEIGRWIWALDSVVPVKRYTPIKGKQGIWEVRDSFIVNLFDGMSPI